jgi:hypothetical protein
VEVKHGQGCVVWHDQGFCPGLCWAVEFAHGKVRCFVRWARPGVMSAAEKVACKWPTRHCPMLFLSMDVVLEPSRMLFLSMDQFRCLAGWVVRTWSG